MVSAEKQPAETAHHGRQLLLSSNINSKLRAVDHTDPASEPTPGGALSLFFFTPPPSFSSTLDCSQLRPGGDSLQLRGEEMKIARLGCV